MSWIWLIGAILAELGATLSLRASDGFRRRLWLIPIIGGYALAFVFLLLALSEGMQIGVAYGIWVATGMALVAVLARAIWEEALTRRMIAGIAVIAVGVILVEVG